jgi:DNA topoisomerase I (EC 5.99.1.2)
VNKNKFVPTDIGEVVNEFLTNNFAEILDYGFTAKVEQDFDHIANGGEKWKDVLGSFYKEFHPKIEHVEENADRATGERLLRKKTRKQVKMFTQEWDVTAR